MAISDTAGKLREVNLMLSLLGAQTELFSRVSIVLSIGRHTPAEVDGSCARYAWKMPCNSTWCSPHFLCRSTTIPLRHGIRGWVSQQYSRFAEDGEVLSPLRVLVSYHVNGSYGWYPPLS